MGASDSGTGRRPPEMAGTGSASGGGRAGAARAPGATASEPGRGDTGRRGAERPALDYLLVAPALEYSAPTLYALTLASGLMDRGLRIRLLAPGGRFEPVFRDRRIPLQVEPGLDGLFGDWWVARRISADLRGTGVRAVHATSSLKVVAAAALARRLGIPAVATVHRYFAPRVSRDVDWTGVGAVITLSEDLREDLVNRRRAPKEIVRVIPTGVLPGAPAQPPFDRPGAVPIVGTLCDVDKTDAQVDFLHAAREVLGKVPKVEFLVVSGGAESREVRRVARDLDISAHTTFTVFVDTRQALSLMDVCVLPSVEEGPGQTILEAMAAGRPVITTGAGGAFDCVRDEETGLLFDRGDRRKLAAAILRLVEDPGLARRIGEAARKAALERFPLDRMLDETLAAYGAAATAAAAR